MSIEPRVFGRCEVKNGIAPVDRLVSEVMNQEPYKSARRVFWIMDNCSAHRGQKAADRFRDTWPNAILIHTPVHASWLNQVEIYFSIVQRKVLTPNDFSSLAELEQRLLAFQSHYERSASPFNWTFTRHDLHDTSGQDRRQTAGSRSLTEYVTVIPNVSTKLAPRWGVTKEGRSSLKPSTPVRFEPPCQSSALLVVQPLVGWGMLSAARYPIVLYGSIHLFPNTSPQRDPVRSIAQGPHGIGLPIVLDVPRPFWGRSVPHVGRARWNLQPYGAVESPSECMR